MAISHSWRIAACQLWYAKRSARGRLRPAPAILIASGLDPLRLCLSVDPQWLPELACSLLWNPIGEPPWTEAVAALEGTQRLELGAFELSPLDSRSYAIGDENEHWHRPNHEEVSPTPLGFIYEMDWIGEAGVDRVATARTTLHQLYPRLL